MKKTNRPDERHRLTTLFQAAGLLAACAFLAPAQAQETAAAAAAASAGANSALVVPAPAKLRPPGSLMPAPDWAGLTPAQQQALEPLQKDWNELDGTQRSKWLELAPRFAALPPQERERVHERMRAWGVLSPAERQQARARYRWAQQVNKSGDREAKWEAYQALPPEKRQELAAKAARKQAAPPCVTGHSCTASDLEAKPKSNLVPPAPRLVPPKAVAPSVVQAKPGATTVLITQATIPPAHQQVGQAKVWADPELVDSKTLLPKKPTAATSR
ncbi:MAG: DUF3106 domain-containing protein [Paucibacter sp.]|nr:DUF3106 domain-containing protein [Roseateles sp.]